MSRYNGTDYGVPVPEALIDFKEEPITWLDPKRIPMKALSIVQGDPGLGKSTVVLDYVARVTNGDRMPGGEGELFGVPSNVLLLSAEDDISSTIRPKLRLMGADLKRVTILRDVEDEDQERRPFVLSDLRALEVLLETYHPALMVVDPFTAFLPPGKNPNSDVDMRSIFAPLARLAHTYRCVIVVVRHLNKYGSNATAAPPAMYRGAGSVGGITGSVRAELTVALDSDDPTGERRLFGRSKGNIGKKPSCMAFHLASVNDTEVPIVHWDGELERSIDDAVRPTLLDEAPEKLKEAMDWLTAALEDGPQAASLLRRNAKSDAGITRGTLDRAKAALKLNGYKQRQANGQWIWELPSQPAKSPKGPLQASQEPCQISHLRGQVCHWR